MMSGSCGAESTVADATAVWLDIGDPALKDRAKFNAPLTRQRDMDLISASENEEIVMKDGNSAAASSRAATGWFYVGLAVVALLGFIWAQAHGRGSLAAIAVSLGFAALGISTIKSGK